MRTAILVTTYNRPDALKWVLFSIERQIHRPDEVIIADDGSSHATTACCESFKERLPIRHVWLPDHGFRAARTRNVALLSATSEHVIMIDGDCLLPPQFVSHHRRMIENGYLVSGGRWLMGPDQTSQLLSHELDPECLQFPEWKFQSWPLGPLRDVQSRNWSMVRTCNLGVMVEDVYRVGGFDERFTAWGLEDSDFVLRMIHAGIKVRNGRFAASVKHLHHVEGATEICQRNAALFSETQAFHSGIKPVPSVFSSQHSCVD